MPPSKKAFSPAAYSDVKYVMDTALTIPGLQYVCETSGKATHFKQRCNTYRNLLREMAQEMVLNVPGHRAETAYDILVISQVNANFLPDRHGAVLLFKHQEPLGKLINPQTGEEIFPETPSILGD
jgi:hypothetical protein